jgi:hypothetical protein
MRNQIAALAARLMAEDGAADFGWAKRKAARQLGVASTQSLPDNDEIEIELKAYRQLFQPERHAAVIAELRHKALRAMRFFEKFQPYLHGPVLRGTAGHHSVVNLQLFAANEKDLELFLLDHRIWFEISGGRQFNDKVRREVCTLSVVWEGVPLTLELYEPVELRGALRHPAGGAVERADVAALERLLAQETPDRAAPKVPAEE